MSQVLGYACINMGFSERPKKQRITTNRSMIKRTFQQRGIRYASELADLRADDEQYAYEQEYMQKVHDAGFDSAEEYEAYWTHLLKTAEEEHYND